MPAAPNPRSKILPAKFIFSDRNVFIVVLHVDTIDKNMTLDEIKVGQQQMLQEYFFDGWSRRGNLNYLPQGEEYEKQFVFDCYEMIKDYFDRLIKLKLDKAGWIPLLISVVPADDKEIDYFLYHNHTYVLIFISIHNAITSAYHEKIQMHEEVIAEINLHQLVDRLKSLDAPAANKMARIGIQQITPFIDKIDTKPTGSDPDNINRDNDIRLEYNLMRADDIGHKRCRRDLAKKHGLAESYIKWIYYDQNIDRKAKKVLQ